MIEKLAKLFVQAKEEEDKAKAKRIKWGSELAALIGLPDEGSKTHTVGPYKVTLEQRINRKVDWAAFDVAMQGCDQPAPCKIKRELDVPGLKWYADKDPDRYYEICKAITATPGMPGVTVKETK